MYCVNCGVKLADTEKQCPLCGTAAFHPDVVRPPAEPLYPPREQTVRRRSRMGQIILTAAFLLPLIITLLCDLQQDRTINWFGYVAGALLTAYVVLGLPLWFSRPNPVIFVPCGFAAAGLYLLYINLAAGGGWFLTFAFPVTGCAALIVTAVVTLLRYVRRGRLYIFGGACIAAGLFVLLVEYLLTRTFPAVQFLGWSLYPLVVLALLGGLLLFLAGNRSAREVMERKFFL